MQYQFTSREVDSIRQEDSMFTKNNDMERMIEILYYCIEDSTNNGDDESVKWLKKTIKTLRKINK